MSLAFTTYRANELLFHGIAEAAKDFQDPHRRCQRLRHSNPSVPPAQRGRAAIDRRGTPMVRLLHRHLQDSPSSIGRSRLCQQGPTLASPSPPPLTIPYPSDPPPPKPSPDP